MSRILAQLLFDGALVIAIDESSFDNKQAQRYRWQAGSKGIRRMDERSKVLFADACRSRTVYPMGLQESPAANSGLPSS